jgi:glutamate/aspartate transport system substrate-binding protein
VEDFMKRLILVLLALGLVGASAGSVAAQALDGTLKKIKSTGVIRIGYRESSAPFSFMGPEGKPVGYSIDLCDRVARAVQAELKLTNLKVQYVPVTVSNRMELVASGAVDIECGSSTASLSRQERVDFSSLIFVDGGAYLVGRGAGIQGITDFAGKKIGVITGTTTEPAVQEDLQRNGVTATIVPITDHDKGFLALQAGEIDAYASDRTILVGLLIRENAADKFGITDQQFSYEPYALMLRRNDSPFRLAVNRALARLYRSGDIVPIYSKWFGVIGRPSGALLLMYRLFALPE